MSVRTVGTKVAVKPAFRDILHENVRFYASISKYKINITYYNTILLSSYIFLVLRDHELYVVYILI